MVQCWGPSGNAHIKRRGIHWHCQRAQAGGRWQCGGMDESRVDAVLVVLLPCSPLIPYCQWFALLQVCKEQGVPVQLQPPNLSDIDSWHGAFISSTSRLLLPACEVQYINQAGQPSSKVSWGSGCCYLQDTIRPVALCQVWVGSGPNCCSVQHTSALDPGVARAGMNLPITSEAVYSHLHVCTYNLACCCACGQTVHAVLSHVHDAVCSGKHDRTDVSYCVIFFFQLVVCCCVVLLCCRCLPSSMHWCES
jgi:hypothetical protein